VKATCAILFAWLLLWSEGAAPAVAKQCTDDVAMSCAGCCCCARETSVPTTPLAPVPSRSANLAQANLLLNLPTVVGEIHLDRAQRISSVPEAEVLASARVVPLFQRDCAFLI